MKVRSACGRRDAGAGERAARGAPGPFRAVVRRLPGQPRPRHLRAVIAALAHDLHSTIAGTGLAVTFYVIPYGLFQLFYGPLGDRSGKVAVVRRVLLLFAVGTGLCGAVGGLAMLYVLRAATGACAAAVIPLALAYIGDVVPYGQRQAAIAALMAFTALGNVLSTAVGGIVGDFLSWRALFGLYGVCALGVAALLFRVPTERQEERAVHSESYMQRYLAVVRVAQARHLYLLVALEGIFVTGGFTYLGAFLRARFGISYLAIGLILACYAGGTLLTSRYVLRRRLLCLSERQLIVAGGICLGGGFLSLWPLGTPLLAPLPILLMGVGFALFHSTLQTRATELLPWPTRDGGGTVRLLAVPGRRRRHRRSRRGAVPQRLSAPPGDLRRRDAGGHIVRAPGLVMSHPGCPAPANAAGACRW